MRGNVLRCYCNPVHNSTPFPLPISSHGHHFTQAHACTMYVYPLLPLHSHLSFLLSAKHFLNNPASLVLHSLHGLCAINPKLGLDPPNKGSYISPAATE